MRRAFVSEPNGGELDAERAIRTRSDRPNDIVAEGFAAVTVAGLCRAGFVIVLLTIIGASALADEKRIIGQTAKVRIVEGDIVFLGRVDTGAATTSINANSINVSAGQVGYWIINGDKDSVRMSSPIVKQVSISNAEAKEKRYVVYLTIDYDGQAKKMLVNLNDRSRSEYKLLLGRNWLSGSYVVDVDRP